MNDDATKDSTKVPSANSRRSINAILRKTWQLDEPPTAVAEGGALSKSHVEVLGGDGKGTAGLKKLKIGALGGRAGRARSSSMQGRHSSAIELPTVIDNDAELTVDPKSSSITTPATAPASGDVKGSVTFGMTPSAKTSTTTNNNTTEASRNRKKTKTLPSTKLPPHVDDRLELTGSSKAYRLTSAPDDGEDEQNGRSTKKPSRSKKEVKADMIKARDKKGHTTVETGEMMSTKSKHGRHLKHESDDERDHSAATTRAEKKAKQKHKVVLVSGCMSMEAPQASVIDYDSDNPRMASALHNSGLNMTSTVTDSPSDSPPTSGLQSDFLPTSAAAAIAMGSTTTTATADGSSTAAAVDGSIPVIVTLTTAQSAATSSSSSTSATPVMLANASVASAAEGSGAAVGEAEGSSAAPPPRTLANKPFRPSGAMTVMLQLTPAIDEDKETHEDDNATETRKSPMGLAPAFGGTNQDEIKKALALRRAKTIKAESVFERSIS